MLGSRISVFRIKCGKACINTRAIRAVKYVPHVIRTIFFVRCIPKVSRVGVVFRAES